MKPPSTPIFRSIWSQNRCQIEYSSRNDREISSSILCQTKLLLLYAGCFRRAKQFFLLKLLSVHRRPRCKQILCVIHVILHSWLFQNITLDGVPIPGICYNFMSRFCICMNSTKLFSWKQNTFVFERILATKKYKPMFPSFALISGLKDFAMVTIIRGNILSSTCLFYWAFKHPKLYELAWMILKIFIIQGDSFYWLPL